MYVYIYLCINLFLTDGIVNQGLLAIQGYSEKYGCRSVSRHASETRTVVKNRTGEENYNNRWLIRTTFNHPISIRILSSRPSPRQSRGYLLDGWLHRVGGPQQLHHLLPPILLNSSTKYVACTTKAWLLVLFFSGCLRPTLPRRTQMVFFPIQCQRVHVPHMLYDY